MSIRENENMRSTNTIMVLADKESRILYFGRPVFESDGRDMPPSEARILPLPGQAVFEIVVADEIRAIPSIAELEERYRLEVLGEGKARFRKKIPGGASRKRK